MNLMIAQFANVSRQVMCSHALQICPDVTKYGRKIESGKCFCEICFNLFDKILKLVVKPIEKINQAFESFLCYQEPKKCKNNLFPIIQINDQLLDSHIAKSARKSACKQLMSCIPYLKRKSRTCVVALINRS